MQVECAKLSDGKISIRVDNRELAIAPKKSEMDLDSFAEVIQSVVDELCGEDSMMEW